MAHHTSCKDCIFAEFRDNTQTGCRLGMIDKYKQHGIAVEECYDEEKEFFVIPNRMCMKKRNKGWAQNNEDFDIQKYAINKELTPLIHAIVIPKNIEELEQIIIGLIEQSELPHFVSIINSHNLNPNDVLPMITESGLQWELDNVVMDRKEIELIHKHVQKRMLPYYTIIKNPITNSNLLNEVSEYIKESLNSFGCIKKDGTETFSTTMHLFWYMNILDKDFMEFLEYSEKETNQSWIINL